MEVINFKDSRYPQKLLKIKNFPKELYVEGNYKLLNKNSIGIVGTREPTEYGKIYSKYFAQELSKKNICVISGIAMGIDTMAHLGSMQEKGKTVAVLGGGFKDIRPKENKYLYKNILENEGCIITEYSPDTKADSENFPQRNRIISGLSMGVLVVEAKYRSGSTITAKYAKEQKKEIFCIPNRLDSKTGYGTNKLIQQGAHLVTCIDDILQFYDIEEEKNIIYMPPDYQEIYNWISEVPIQISELCKLSGEAISKINEIVCMLEIEGYIKNIPGNYYVRI